LRGPLLVRASPTRRSSDLLSSSMATRRSSRSARNWAVSAATCSALATLRPNRATETRPSPRRRRTQSGAVVPSKPGCRTASASRVRVSVPVVNVVMRWRSSLHGAGGEAADGLALQVDEEDQDRDGEERRGGHGRAPVVAELALEAGQP